MNKRLFVLICSIILFQYIYSGTACTEATLGADEGDTFTQQVCNKRDGSGTKICVVKLEGEPAAATGCELKEKATVSCASVKGTSDAICKGLKTTAGNVCKKAQNKNECTEVKEEKASSSSYSLKFSLVLFIFLFLF